MRDQVVIVGGGVAAMRCALELRERGFDGRLSILSAESTPPSVFALDDEEISVVVDPHAADVSKLRLAAEACPTEAIRIGEPSSDADG
jgi:NADPH-dependent 2,4-dienoyl-CoA reductase/sulfur reductase-like enzyme